MFDEKLKLAYEKAQEFSGYLQYPDERMVSTQDIIRVLEERYCPDVDISFASFANAGLKKPYGAMMRIELGENDGNPTRADIILNTDNDAEFQRFSLLHEIGHLVTRAWERNEVHGADSHKYVVSTHIDYNITNISKDEYEQDTFLQNEQMANIFALRVLMPTTQFYKKIKELQTISSVADFFGLSEEAVISRARVGA